MKRKPFLSPTAINAYLRCPRAYYYRYIEKRKSKPSIHLVRGIAVHEALAKFYDQDITPETDVESLRFGLIQRFSEAWRKQAATIARLGLPQSQLDKIFKESIGMLYAWFYRFMEKAGLGVNRPQTEARLYSRRFNLMGIVDAIYETGDRVVLVDYKTSAKDELTPEIRVQMSLYALLYMDKYGRKPDTICVDFLATGRKSIQPVSDAMIRHAKQLCWSVGAKTQSRNKEDYPCTCGGWCERDFDNATPSRKGNAA